MTFKLEIGSFPSSGDIESRFEDLAAAAKSVYDEWLQDEDGFDDVLGAGGICQDIASKMLEVLDSVGVQSSTTVHTTIGENHVFVVALLDDGVFSIDIPPHVYETGGGYVWKKREDAVIDASVIQMMRIGDPMDEETFNETYSDC